MIYCIEVITTISGVKFFKIDFFGDSIQIWLKFDQIETGVSTGVVSKLVVGVVIFESGVQTTSIR